MESTPPCNKQLYVNSGLKELFADAPPNDKGFFNPRDPNLAILHEKPEHRLLLWMKAQGASNREIAQQSGYTEPWLSQLFRQPWAQVRLVEMLTEAGVDVVHGLLKAAAPDSVLKLIEIRDNPKINQTHPGVVRSCCVDLLEHYLGKPKQQVEVRSENKTSLDITELDAEIAKHDKEINRLLGVV
jgi:hypothetical protein